MNPHSHINTGKHVKRLVEERNELVAALRPFAALLQEHNNKPERSGGTPIFAINDAVITLHDLREARRLIEQHGTNVVINTE